MRLTSSRNRLLRSRGALTLILLLLTLLGIRPARGGGRLQIAAPGVPGMSPGEESQGRDSAPSGPQPPCGKEPIPSYPGLDDSPIVKSWSEADFGAKWTPPPCTGWAAAGFTTLVTTVARFRHPSDAEALLHRIGAISELAGMRYWSSTHERWQTLIVDAHAVTDSEGGQRRKDFLPAEMTKGETLYFEQVDNLSGVAVYRMQIAESSMDRIVFEVENVGTIRYLLLPIFHPGDMQSIYFLDRESDNVWRYYSMVRVGKHGSHLIAKNASSSINRALASYRHLVGIPTDQEPPAAR